MRNRAWVALPMLMASTALADTQAITRVRIVTVSGPVIEEGTILIEDGRIKELGTDLPVPAGASVRDGQGLTAYPGLVDLDTTLGLTEIGGVRATVDVEELGDFNPEARAYVALHSDSEIIPTVRANGVMTALVSPRGGVVSGQATFVQLDGWTWEEMTLVREAALSIVWPSSQRGFDFFGPEKSREQREKEAQEKIARLKEFFRSAKDYAGILSRGPAGGRPPLDRRLEAMAAYVRGERPVLVRADREKEIRAALDFIAEFGLKGVIWGGADAWKVAELLKEKEIPVILSVLRLPTEREDPYDAAYLNPLRMKEAGVRFAIASGSASDSRNLPYEAALAAAYGLGPEEALKSITLYPAQILGLAGQFGSLEAGKRADLFLARGDILDARTEVVQVYVGGRPVSMETRHTRLYDKWRKR